MAGILGVPAILACLMGGIPPARAVDLADGPTVSRQLDDGRRAGRTRPGPIAGATKPPFEIDADGPLSLHQVYAMYFGTLVDNDGYVVLDANDTIVDDPANLVYGGAPFSAEIQILGDPFRSIGVSIASPGAPGMTLTGFTSNYGPLPLAGVTIGESGEVRLHLGARLTLSTAVQPGQDKEIGYVVTVMYE